ncbi:hypothetical protein VTN49DRAFT_7234 [Thermomyces lanuginosus]|uniref:uncharacterized protein n=1 Tax=Thermomyces lanuginosus TaxID=5541 RepID=UPI003743A3D6
MAEALAAVGTIANIIQLVDAGLKVLHRLEEYQSQIQDLPEAFRHIKTELPALLDALQHTKTAIDTGSLPDESKRAVLPVVEGCATRIKLLDEILEKVVPASKDSWAARGKKAIQSIRPSADSGPAPSSTIPFRRDPHFVDRGMLTEIQEKGKQQGSRVALVGLGGVG